MRYAILLILDFTARTNERNHRVIRNNNPPTKLYMGNIFNIFVSRRGLKWMCSLCVPLSVCVCVCARAKCHNANNEQWKICIYENVWAVLQLSHWAHWRWRRSFFQMWKTEGVYHIYTFNQRWIPNVLRATASASVAYGYTYCILVFFHLSYARKDGEILISRLLLFSTYFK